MSVDDRPTVPPGLAELRHDLVRLRWAEKSAYGTLLEKIRSHPEVSQAFERWVQAHERRVEAEELLGQVERDGGRKP